MSRLSHLEIHMVHRIGWLRAAVLGANDGLVSTSSLVVGVAATGSGRTEVLIAGLAGLVADAMSMAAGEYVSVSSQTDAENADVAPDQAVQPRPASPDRALTSVPFITQTGVPFCTEIWGPDSTVIDSHVSMTPSTPPRADRDIFVTGDQQ